MFGITDQELDDIVKYDILSIMSSHFNMMRSHQKKCVVNLLEAETEFKDLSLVLDNLSVFIEEEYLPYLIKLIDRLNVHPVIRAAYQVLIKYFRMWYLENNMLSNVNRIGNKWINRHGSGMEGGRLFVFTDC